MDDFLDVQDVILKLRVSRSYAYKVIRILNEELQEQGYRVVSGRVPKRYFSSRYCLELEAIS